MLRYLRQNPNCLLWVLLLLWTALNVVTAVGTELIGDECYYWVLAHHLEAGYFDHPPFFALLNHLGVLLGGDTEFGVRLFTILIQPLYVYLFWTVVRTPSSDYRSALRYFLMMFSLPMLHIYGFVATPDAPLLLSVAVTLWAFKRYAYSQKGQSNGYLLSILLLAVGFAMMGYAKYHGALVVAAIIVSRPRMLTDWRFYVSAAIALALFAPHIYWQYSHDFISFRYHLVERGTSLSWGALSDYVVNFVGVYNPFLTIPFLILLCGKRPTVKEPMERLMRFMGICFLLFFLYSTTKGHVQPQWLLPMAFAIVFLLFRKAEHSVKMARYLTRTSLVMGFLLFSTHIFALSTNLQFRNIDLFGSKPMLVDAQKELGDAELFVLEGNYASAAKLDFYTTIQTYARPSLYSRSSHYEYLDIDQQYYGRRVAVEIGERGRKEIPNDTLAKYYHQTVLPIVGTVYFDIVEHYIPTQAVSIELQSFPSKVLIEQRLALLLQIKNPYNFDIGLGGKNGFNIVMHIRAKKNEFIDILLPFKEQILGANGGVNIATTATIPALETGEYRVGFSLQRRPFGSWYNSKVYSLLIVNPKTRV